MMTKQNSRQISYSDKNVFVGLDVHKKTYAVVARVDGVIAKRWTTVAEPQKLADQLLKYFQGGRIYTAYEAGFSGLALHRTLTEQGISNLVVHAAGVEVAVSDRVKTDKRDAAKLASLLESNRLTGIRILTETEKSQRQLTRTRQQLVEERTAVKNKIRMKLYQLGVIAADENKQMSHRWVKELLGRISSPEFTLAIEAYSHVWKTLDEEIATLEKALKQQAKADPNESIYRSAPGVGSLSARVLSNELIG